jgi:hypothetical protein
MRAGRLLAVSRQIRFDGPAGGVGLGALMTRFLFSMIVVGAAALLALAPLAR